MKSKLACALLMLAPFVSDVQGQNVLNNPGFEEEGGWNHWGAERINKGHTGDYALKISNLDFKWSGTDQMIVMPEGVKTLTVSGYMKVDSVVRGNKPWEKARIAVEFYDEDNHQVGGFLPVVAESFGTREWKHYERVYQVPSKAFSAKVQLALGNATGTVYFDEIKAVLKDPEENVLEAGVIKPEPPKPEDFIRLNQLGYYPHGPKKAVVVSSDAKKFKVIDAETNKKVFKGKLDKKGVWEHSGEDVSHADFSKLTKPGTYYIEVPGLANSHPFKIADNIALEMGKASLKTFYFQRTVIDLDEKYAGKWARKAGHPDKEVLVHASAATEERPEGTKISAPFGWYDAGDYNKYIVNSGITTYTMLALYEHFPEFAANIDVNIPESDNDIPDLLDETLYNIRWMLAMQDPNDGGVYHKLTNPNFDGEIMPHEAKEPRYVVKKSTAATLDFAAVMATASRIFKNYEKQLPGFADSTLAAAKQAYEWAKKNPEEYYDQNEMNKKFKPAIVTGEYGDKKVSDEFQWAASELYIATGDEEYYKAANIVATLDSFAVPAWPEVNTLGLISLANQGSKIKDADAIKGRIVALADELKNHAAESEFGTPMGIEKGNFVWGSNSFATNQGIVLIQAYRLTKDPEYLYAAIANLDYILGRNGTGYSYVSGFGSKPMKNPHHRPSQTDGVKEVIPGFMTGGPNYEQQDKYACMKPYPSKLPAKSYLDEECSYAANEVAINWNSPLTYMTLAIEALMAEKAKK
ncbi:glycoside hydrolase family 9 protein [Cytophagaceae bacterium ABcell3]|nr:glycoside hydrolase family 9 protein [Cytophagaceae bacterium ABcell3]